MPCAVFVSKWLPPDVARYVHIGCEMSAWRIVWVGVVLTTGCGGATASATSDAGTDSAQPNSSGVADGAQPTNYDGDAGQGQTAPGQTDWARLDGSILDVCCMNSDNCGQPYTDACLAAGGRIKSSELGALGTQSACCAPVVMPTPGTFVCVDTVLCDAGSLCVLLTPATDGTSNTYCMPPPSACDGDGGLNCPCIAANWASSSSSGYYSLRSCAEDDAGDLNIWIESAP
jgi:hypothetical protein